MKINIATTNVDLMGERFTKECLAQVANEFNTCKITFGSHDNKIGTATNATFDGERLWIDGILELRITRELYCVPAGVVRNRDKDDIRNFRLMECVITDRPTDQTLISIGVKNGD